MQVSNTGPQQGVGGREGGEGARRGEGARERQGVEWLELSALGVLFLTPCPLRLCACVCARRWWWTRNGWR